MSVIQEMIERIRKLKKTDWAVLALLGVLLLIIAIPTGEKTQSGATSFSQKTEENPTESENSSVKSLEKDDYIASLENRLEKVLSQMEGVGKVAVMITVSDNGSSVVEKDVTKVSSTTTESEEAGGSRTVTEQQTEQNTVYVENGQEKEPYIQKENLPTIEGVVVVAEGGGNARINSDISETVQALFAVEIHKIKVVKMESKEG